MSSKCYHAVNAVTNDIKAGLKGVKHTEAKKLSIDDFASCLYDDVIPTVTSRELHTNDKNQMIYTETSKKGLNPIFKKFRVQSDKISCLPLTRNGEIL